MNWSKPKIEIKNRASSTEWLHCRNHSQLKSGISERGASHLILNISGKIATLISTGKKGKNIDSENMCCTPLYKSGFQK